MQDYGYPGLSPFAEAFERLQRARTLQLWLRTALWAWSAIIFAWALPVGPWSAAALPVWAVAASGVTLAAGGALLAYLHRRAGRTDAIYAAIERGTMRRRQ